MGIEQAHALGRLRRGYVTRQSALLTFAPPVSASAVKMIAAKMSAKTKRENRMDSRQTRSLLERITGFTDIAWSLATEVVPSGTAGTPPDVHDLLLAHMGAYANVADTSDTYSYSDLDQFTSTGGVAPLSIVAEYAGTVMQAVYGALVDQMKISASGTAVAKMEFSGEACGFIHTGTSTCNGGTTGSTVIVQTADADNFEVGSVLQIGASTNSGEGHRVTAKTGPTLTVTGTPDADDLDPIKPFVPTETTAGSVAPGLLGSISFDSLTGVGFPITAWEVTSKNNIEMFKDEAFSATANDASMGFREVTGSLTIRARKDQIIQLGHIRNGGYVTRPIVLTLGTGAGKRCRINIPTAEIDATELDVPEEKEGTIALPWTAIGPGEMTLTYL